MVLKLSSERQLPSVLSIYPFFLDYGMEFQRGILEYGKAFRFEGACAYVFILGTLTKARHGHFESSVHESICWLL
jgi:hypothetical protein